MIVTPKWPTGYFPDGYLRGVCPHDEWTVKSIELIYCVKRIQSLNRMSKCSKNLPVRDRQNALRLCDERTACVDHDKSARTTLGVIEETQ